MHLDLVTAPAAEPLSLAEAQSYRRVDGSTEAGLLTDLISAARELFEEETGRQVITAAWRLRMSGFPRGGAPIRIPKPPLISVSSITYIDVAGDTQTWSASEYVVTTSAGPFARHGLVHPAPNYCYPDTLGTPDAVVVNFSAGYGDSADDVPESVRYTIQSLLGDLYEERESFITGTIVSQNPSTMRALARYRLPVMA